MKRRPDDQVRDQVVSQDKRRRSETPAGKKDEKKAVQGRREREKVTMEVLLHIFRRH